LWSTELRLRLAFPVRHVESILCSARPGKHQEDGSMVSSMTHCT
jgi:hypothetical protein